MGKQKLHQEVGKFDINSVASFRLRQMSGVRLIYRHLTTGTRSYGHLSGTPAKIREQRGERVDYLVVGHAVAGNYPVAVLHFE